MQSAASNVSMRQENCASCLLEELRDSQTSLGEWHVRFRLSQLEVVLVCMRQTALPLPTTSAPRSCESSCLNSCTSCCRPATSADRSWHPPSVTLDRNMSSHVAIRNTSFGILWHTDLLDHWFLRSIPTSQDRSLWSIGPWRLN